MDETTFNCKLNNIEHLKDFNSNNLNKVRWLDVVKDYDMIKEYFKLFNVDIESKEKNSMYFGIYINDYSGAAPAKGKSCALIYEDKILSFAVVKFKSTDSWEICAGSTHPQHFNKGYSKAVCSFIAKYILDNKKTAICETNINNKAAQKVLQAIGMFRV